MSDSETSVRDHAANNFDLFRLIFASLVVLSHSYEFIVGNRSREPLTRVFHTISFGEFAVDFFFILSGYLIAMSWESDPDWSRFLRKRVARIYPGFIVAFLFSTLIAGTIGSQNTSTYLGNLHPFHLFIEMLFLVSPTTPPTFTEWSNAFVNGALWTIHYEFFCYLMLLTLGLSGLLKRTHLVVLLWVVGLAGFFAFRLQHAHDHTTGAVNGGVLGNFIRLIPLYLSGIVFYKTKLYQNRSVGLFLIMLTVFVVGLTNKLTAEISIATAGSYVMLVLGYTPLRFQLFRRTPDFSYGLYLYGWPIIKLIIFSRLTTSPFLIFILSLGLSTCFGLLSWRFIERPFLKKARRARYVGLAAETLADAGYTE